MTTQKSTSGTSGAQWTPSMSGQLSQQMASCRRSPRMCRTQTEPWLSTLCFSSVSAHIFIAWQQIPPKPYPGVKLIFFLTHSSLGWEIPWKDGWQPRFPGYPLLHCWSFYDASHRWALPSLLVILLCLSSCILTSDKTSDVSFQVSTTSMRTKRTISTSWTCLWAKRRPPWSSSCPTIWSPWIAWRNCWRRSR